MNRTPVLLAAAFLFSPGAFADEPRQSAQQPDLAAVSREFGPNIDQSKKEMQAARMSSPGVPPGNFGLVSEGSPNGNAVLPGKIYRGEKLVGEADYGFLRQKKRVDIIMNLRKWESDDEKLCKKYGFECVRYGLFIIVGSDWDFNWREFQEAFRFVIQEQQAGKTIFFHCVKGSDRTGALAAAIKIRETTCGKQFDPDLLWASIEHDLEHHHFHILFPFLHRRIHDWVYNPSQYPWLCQ